jgi:N-acetylglucosaminyldiphosphoundecaprenol N-acetyl-beta-D-mannosaminyltransferase
MSMPLPRPIDIVTSCILPSPASFQVLGVRVDAVQIPDVVSRMTQWIEQRQSGNYIAVTGMHGVMEAQYSAAIKAALNGASLVVPDGMPLVWVGKARRFPMRRRVYGPELMETFCRVTGSRFSHFFYGGAPGVADKLGEVMKQRFDIRVAGTYSPPFRHLNPEEERNLIDLLRRSRPDILWVGLSTPKQESWMSEYRERAGVPVLVGVGAAFDFFTGRTRQAPSWMREHGFEWLFRLSTEPRRLWRRYIIYGSQFAWNVTLELAGIKRFT